MTVEIIKYKKGGYGYSVSVIEEAPLWVYRSSKNSPNPVLPNDKWEDVHRTVSHFLSCQYRPYKERWLVQVKKEVYGRVWTFRLLA